jgi:pimeloyl-ACP methyl ester carboxylesterase
MLVPLQPETYVRYCELLRDYDLRGRLGAIAAPTLAVAGEEDRTAPPEVVEAVANEISGARFTVIPNAAHLLNVERADEFNDALVAHLS